MELQFKVTFRVSDEFPVVEVTGQKISEPGLAELSIEDVTETLFKTEQLLAQFLGVSVRIEQIL